jgi:hypothetical protein
VRRSWLVLKPLRFELAAMAAASLLLSAIAILAASQIDALGDVRPCLQLQDVGQLTPDSPCVSVIENFMRVRSGVGRQVMGLFAILPFVVGAFVGVPIVGREIESGTAPMAWALAGSRPRWLLARMLRLAPVVVVILLPAVITSDILESRLEPLLDPTASFVDWGSRGFPLLAYGIAACAVGIGSGALLGCTLPALIVAGFVCLLIQQGAHPVLRRALAFQAVPRDTAGAFTARADLPIRTQAFDADGNPIEDLAAWIATHQAEEHAGNGARVVEYVIPGRRYVEVELSESLAVLLGAAVLGGASLVLVQRRRPY